MSLAYIDKHLDDPAMRAAVDSLVAAELAAMKTSSHPALSTDAMGAMGAPAPSNAIDTSRLQLNPPAKNQSDNEEAWASAVANAHAAVEHQRTRLANLALLSRYAANAWRVHNWQLEAAVQRVRSEADAVKAQTLDLNRARKTSQMRTGNELELLEARWAALVDAVLRVDIANGILEAEIEELETELGVSA
ncbi:hypothetical protein HDU83_002138 [Entophlyctis luteolus]|nr:hypothetical protein HDU82_003287 [Entophlyctis luteolus]KAJ3347379.1 hypothetical protein HDU83_002138 [Entophlyctis luteolus]KAJ3380628.1 hypothetical protein HDU84_005677 [Entophlyctis sp. JEL0112]